MRVHHLNCATLRPLGRLLVNGEGWPLEPGRMVCRTLLLETANALVLVDSGFGTADLADPVRALGRALLLSGRPALDPAETAIARVRALGHDPRDVRHVVATHLDVDHAGGLPDFPWATVHTTAAEHRAATTRPTFLDQHRYRAHHFAHGPRWATYEPGGEAWEGMGGVCAVEGLGGDVLLVPLGGHSSGHAGVAVRAPEGWLLHAGDAYFSQRQVDPTRPWCPPALTVFQNVIAADAAARRRNLVRVRRLPAHIEVVCSHDPHSLDSRRSA